MLSLIFCLLCGTLHPQIANRHRDRRRLPTYKLLEAISKVLDLTQQFPYLQVGEGGGDGDLQGRFGVAIPSFLVETAGHPLLIVVGGEEPLCNEPSMLTTNKLSQFKTHTVRLLLLTCLLLVCPCSWPLCCSRS